MSNFTNLKKNICLDEKEIPQTEPKCPPIEEPVPTEDKPYYDSKKKRYYVMQTMDAQDNFLKSAEASKENVNEISRDIGQAAKLRIIKFFNFKLTSEEIEKIPIILEDYTVY